MDMSSFQGMSVDDLAELYEKTMPDLLDMHYLVVKECRKFGPLTPGSMPNAVNLGDIQECSRGDTDERDLILIGWRGYSNSRKCMRYMKRKTIIIG